jgi:formylglycine-generating enzyme required for sulfatase activity
MRWFASLGALLAFALASCSAPNQDVISAAPSRGSIANRQFDDCGGARWCPRMITLEAGDFVMGSDEKEPLRDSDEGPRRRTHVRSFALGVFEVTFSQWFACVNDGGCEGYAPPEYAAGLDEHPVINISWRDAQRYTAWLSQRTGETYRLPTEAEWEYAARAGSLSAYPWGDTADHGFANYGAEACCAGVAVGADRWLHTAPAGSFPANAFGLHDMHGNAWEWVEDCYSDSYADAPTDGSPRRADACARRILRGGSWLFGPNELRSAARRTHRSDVRTGSLGLRVARNL